jgi:hypothetical protein
MAAAREIRPHGPGLTKGKGRNTVAKLIEFYIPCSFRRKDKWIPAEQRGKVIAFAPERKKSA